MNDLDFATLPESLKRLDTRPLFLLRESIPPLLVIGETPNAFRRVGMVQGGSFAGERLSGEVLTGNDWQTIRKDNCMKLSVRMVLKTTDGVLIAMAYTATRAGEAGILHSLDQGIAVDPSSYYFRITAEFETSSPKYDWLNRIVAIGIGSRLADGPLYSLFEVL